ncbi:hypothetical protein L484_005770 [Morus notabilis]|uniref:Uncharacterized protein n=1 Tax=Morus notabilis TaxID=981085 RepID=W9S3J2_9ROSA|nr:hypothetical protein L484_005770 [Morus notabilis]
MVITISITIMIMGRKKTERTWPKEPPLPKEYLGNVVLIEQAARQRIRLGAAWEINKMIASRTKAE